LYRRKTVHAILTVLLVFVLINPAFAVPNQTSPTPATDNSQATQDRQSSTESTATTGLEQALAEAEMAVRQAQADRIRQELDTLGEELERLNTEYFAETAKLAAIEQSLTDTRERLRWFEAEFEAQRQVLNDRVTNIYKHGDIEPLDAIINNKSFSEVYTRLTMLLKISEQDAKLLEQLRDQKLKVETAKSALDQLRAQQQEITAELEGRKKAIEAKIQEETELLASIDEQTRAILEQEAIRQQQEQQRLANRLKSKPGNGRDKISIEPGTIGFEAIQYLGVPYVWGGENPAIGLDCSGLVLVVFRKFGVELPHYSRSQAKLGAAVSYNDLQPGDLVFFGNPIHHVGIYLGEGYYIHAPKRNDVVKISKLSERNDYACARRIITVLPR